MMGGMKQTEIHCMHIWKCHNEAHSTGRYYILIKMLKIKVDSFKMMVRRWSKEKNSTQLV
jgi:hypothetical protein